MELGVHIADVTHFVPAGSLTDLEAQSRSTTVYLADRRHDMIPTILSADLCSLLSEVDRYVGVVRVIHYLFIICILQQYCLVTSHIMLLLVYQTSHSCSFAVSVIWTLNPDTYEVLDVWYGRTVIRSAYKLFYEVKILTKI